MKVIKINSDDEYGAMLFDEYGTASEENWNIANETGKLVLTKPDGSTETVAASAHEFGDVDIKFIQFVGEMQDYDACKHTDFFVVT